MSTLVYSEWALVPPCPSCWIFYLRNHGAYSIYTAVFLTTQNAIHDDSNWVNEVNYRLGIHTQTRTLNLGLFHLPRVCRKTGLGCTLPSSYIGDPEEDIAVNTYPNTQWVQAPSITPNRCSYMYSSITMDMAVLNTERLTLLEVYAALLEWWAYTYLAHCFLSMHWFVSMNNLTQHWCTSDHVVCMCIGTPPGTPLLDWWACAYVHWSWVPKDHDYYITSGISNMLGWWRPWENFESPLCITNVPKSHYNYSITHNRLHAWDTNQCPEMYPCLQSHFHVEPVPVPWLWQHQGLRRSERVSAIMAIHD